MNPSRSLPALGLLVALLLPAPTVYSGSLAPPDLSELVTSSSLVVHGEVVGATSRWNEDRSLIVTDVRLRVLTSAKGTAPAEVVLTQPGGTVGKLRVDVAGAHAFRVGEEVVVFLAPGPRGRLYINGLSRGRLDVVRDTATGAASVQGMALGGAAGAGSPIIETGARDLARFLDRVRMLVEGVIDGGRD